MCGTVFSDCYFKEIPVKVDLTEDTRIPAVYLAVPDRSCGFDLQRETVVLHDAAMAIGRNGMKFDVSEMGFVIDADEVEPLLDLTSEEMRRPMQIEEITSVSEIGEGDDTERHRITLRHGPIRVRWTIEEEEHVLSRLRVVARLSTNAGRPLLRHPLGCRDP